MFQHRQDKNGNTYHYDPDCGAVVYGEADADDFVYTNGVTYLSACGCPAEAGCQCHRNISAQTPTAEASLAEVRAGVERVKREMAAEAEAAITLRRVRNEIARDYAYAVNNPPPEPYTLALAERGTVPAVWRSDGGCPEPYSLALGGGIAQRRADGTLVRLPDGDDPPLPYTLALEARCSPQRDENDN